MSKPVSHPRNRFAGYATVMVMLLLVLGLVFCAWLFSMISNSTAVTRNDLDAARAQMAAESGLVYMSTRIGERTKAKRLKGKTPEAILQTLADDLNSRVPGGVTIETDAAGVRYLRTGNIALGGGMSFTAVLLPSAKGSFDYSLQVQGRGGRPQAPPRTVAMEGIREGHNSVSAMNFPMVSKRLISLHSSATDVYRGNSGVKAKKPPTVATNADGDKGAYILQWDDDPTDYSQESIRFPELPPESLYESIDALYGRRPANRNADTSQADSFTAAGGVIRRYSGAKEHVFSDSSFTGVIYVRWPGKLKIAADTTINGMIIFEPNPAGLADDVNETPSYMKLDSGLEFTLNASNAVIRSELSARDQWDDAKDYSKVNWAIMAPNTDLDFDKNQKAQKTIRGSVDIFSSGDNGNFKNMVTIEGGSMVLEGPFQSNGTYDLRITPASNGGSTGENDGGYSLEFDNRSYWER